MDRFAASSEDPSRCRTRAANRRSAADDGDDDECEMRSPCILAGCTRLSVACSNLRRQSLRYFGFLAFMN